MCSPAVAYAPYSTMSALPKAKPAPTISIPARPARRARPSPLTGMADLALEDALILACAPTPKQAETPSTLLTTPIITHTTPSPSPLHLTFGPAAFSFPKPPRHASCSPVRSSSPGSSSMPSLSPSRSSPKSPVTSDDDDLPATPVNAPISLGSIRPLSIRKAPTADNSDVSDYDSEAEDEFDDGASWYARELGPIISFPQASSLRSNSKRDSFVLGPARPESYLPVPSHLSGSSIKRRSSIRVTRALLDNQKNLAVSAVDPALPGRRQSRRVAHSQLLPPRPSLFTAAELLPVTQTPVTPVTPISASLRVPRFPPRNPVPVDIFTDELHASPEACVEEGSTPCTPFFPDTDEEADSAEWDDLSALDDVPFDLAQIAFAAPTPAEGFVLEALEEEICDNETELGSNVSVVGFSMTPATRAQVPVTPPRASRVPSRPASPVKAVQVSEEKVLRSRWSTSTLGSIASPTTSSRTSKLRGFFSGSRKSTQPTPSTPSPLPTATPTKTTSHKKVSSSSKESTSPSRFAMFSPRAHQRRSMDSDVSAVSVNTSSGSPTRALGRRDSRESMSSESSAKSLPQRKGIPMQLLARS